VILIGPDGVEYTCRLLYVSAGQINFILPAIPQTISLGQNSLLAAIDIRDENGTIHEEGIVLKRASPALFSANSSGAGVAAGGLLRVRADGSTSEEPIAQLDPAQNKLVPIPIEFTSDTQRLTLSLFGTGFGSSGRVEANIAGMGVPVLFAGEQPELQGLVRIDLELGRTLAGAGEVPIQVIVDGNAANQVTIGFR
jgi:uncharacterized protein (TIGR03437 family)